MSNSKISIFNYGDNLEVLINKRSDRGTCEPTRRQALFPFASDLHQEAQTFIVTKHPLLTQVLGSCTVLSPVLQG